MSNTINHEKYILKLFGQQISLTTNDGNREDLKNVAEYFKSVVEELQNSFKSKSQLDIAILAGLKITDELYSYLKSNKSPNLQNLNNKKNMGEIEKKLITAIKQLDISLKM